MIKQGKFLSEYFTEHYIRDFKIDKLLFEGRTKYQFAQCFTNQYFGKILFLDDKIQSAQIDEFVYHETLVHPVMVSHPDPRNVLILGGGEGATLREILKYANVKQAVMVDIDGELVEICKQLLPEWSAGAFEDPRTELIIGDARNFIESSEKKYDIIISDLTEPVGKGPSVKLFTKEFYEKIYRVLNDNGLFVLQAGSTDMIHYDFFVSCALTLKSVFPLVMPYWTFVLSFGLPWGFVMAAKDTDFLEPDEKMIKERCGTETLGELKFYQPCLHKCLLTLPVYLQKVIKKGRVLTDDEPFIWTA